MRLPCNATAFWAIAGGLCTEVMAVDQVCSTIQSGAGYGWLAMDAAGRKDGVMVVLFAGRDRS